MSLDVPGKVRQEGTIISYHRIQSGPLMVPYLRTCGKLRKFDWLVAGFRAPYSIDRDLRDIGGSFVETLGVMLACARVVAYKKGLQEGLNAYPIHHRDQAT